MVGCKDAGLKYMPIMDGVILSRRFFLKGGMMDPKIYNAI